MRGHPVANALGRHLLARNEIAVDEHSLDRAVAIAIVRIITDAQRRAVLEDHARRALDLDHEQIECALDPADFKFLPVERAGLYGGAVVVGDELVVLVAATDPRPFVRECNGSGLVSGGREIFRSAIQRDMEFGTRKPRAFDDRLEITGQKSLALAQPRDANGPKIPFEEGARGIGILWPQFRRVATHVQQRGRDLSALVAARRLLPQRLAAGLIGCEGGEVVIGLPAHEVCPFDRLELAVRQFQRYFGRCGIGRAT